MPLYAFVSISYAHKAEFQETLEIIKKTAKLASIEPYIFVQEQEGKLYGVSHQEMMGRAFREIDCADLLIAEVSNKAIGVGIEIGYAKALGKPIIYLRKAYSELSTTVAGTADYEIVYLESTDLHTQLAKVLLKIKNSKNSD